jgi:hypothetical protein
VQYKHDHNMKQKQDGDKMFMTLAFPESSQGADWEFQIMRTHLLLFPQSEQTNSRHLHNLETYTRNITLGLTPTTETRDENFIVLIHKVQATIVLRIKTRKIIP